jgi:ABC-2 type transport system permease protein
VAWSIAVLETRRFLSDKISLFTTVILPTILVLVIGISVGGQQTSLPIGIVDKDATPESQAFVDSLGSDTLTVTTYTDDAALARDLRLGAVSAGVEVPEGFSAAIQSQDEQAPIVMSLEVASSEGTAVATALLAAAAAYGEEPTAVRVATEVLDLNADQQDLAQSVAGGILDQTPAVTTDTTLIGTVRPDDENGFARAVPTQLVLFVFLNGMLAAQTLVDSRRLGVSRRMLSTPTGVGPHILGIGIGRFGLGLLQSAILLLVGAFGFGVEFGDPVAVAVLVVVWAALAAAVGMLVGSVARTPDQVVAIGVPLGIGFGMLGGSMWPLSIVPDFMGVIGHIVPHGWANDAWSVVINDSGGVADIGGELVILLGFTVVLAACAVVLLRRSLSR